MPPALLEAVGTHARPPASWNGDLCLGNNCFTLLYLYAISRSSFSFPPSFFLFHPFSLPLLTLWPVVARIATDHYAMYFSAGDAVRAAWALAALDVRTDAPVASRGPPPATPRIPAKLVGRFFAALGDLAITYYYMFVLCT